LFAHLESVRKRLTCSSAGDLRIVQQHEISRPDQLEQLDSVRGEHPCVMAELFQGDPLPREWLFDGPEGRC